MIIMLIPWTVFSINKTKWPPDYSMTWSRLWHSVIKTKKVMEDMQRTGEEREGVLLEMLFWLPLFSS